VDFAGENRGGIYLDAQLCEFKLRVVKYKFLEEIAQTFACAMGVSFVVHRVIGQRWMGGSMRKVIVSNLASLDSYFEGPNNELDWFVVDEEFFAYARGLLRTADTLLFGRATYEHMAGYWPSAPRDEIADKMNHLAKVVFSMRSPTLNWNNSRFVSGDAVEEVARLKQEPGGNMVVFGSAALASSLLQAGLIDEYRVILQPVLLGSGKPLFPNVRERLRLRLLRTQSFGSGVVVLYYQRA
jgi:dihydrofolate reductase